MYFTDDELLRQGVLEPQPGAAGQDRVEVIVSDGPGPLQKTSLWSGRLGERRLKLRMHLLKDPGNGDEPEICLIVPNVFVFTPTFPINLKVSSPVYPVSIEVNPLYPSLQFDLITLQVWFI